MSRKPTATTKQDRPGIKPSGPEALAASKPPKAIMHYTERAS